MKSHDLLRRCYCLNAAIKIIHREQETVSVVSTPPLPLKTKGKKEKVDPENMLGIY